MHVRRFRRTASTRSPAPLRRLLRLIPKDYHSPAARGMPYNRKCVVTGGTYFMRIATWNVNSVRQRLDHLLTWLRDCGPDIVCLQEIKCVDEAFPREAIEALGYNVVTHGQKTFNGVALLSKLPFDETKSGLAGDDEDAHARFLEGAVLQRHHALEEPGMGVFVVPGEARLGFVERQLRQQCDAVKGLLAVGDHVVAERLDGLPRKCLVDAFDFLQADDVGTAIPQPGQEMVEPLPDRIDVPRSNTHEKSPARNDTFSVVWHTTACWAVIIVGNKAQKSP